MRIFILVDSILTLANIIFSAYFLATREFPYTRTTTVGGSILTMIVSISFLYWGVTLLLK